MADLLPIDTGSPALAELLPDAGITRLDVKTTDLIADLKAIAARREREGLLAEQRHQLFDLDADSSCPFEGACRYPYLNAGGQS